MRFLYMAGIAYLLATAFALTRGLPWVSHPIVTPVTTASTATNGGGGAWFERARSRCNTLEVEIVHRHDPPPTSLEGVGYSAACWALAGRIDDARRQILTLPVDDRWKAAGIVFNVGHPVADMGDDLSAGPIMELVVEFWPNHYMALYHAGAARYALGDFEPAKQHLQAFLQTYDQNDGWTSRAKAMLQEIGSR